MHIHTLNIKNFKLFKDVTVILDPHVNILTGANNSGKTTVLEALALWGACLLHLLSVAGKSDARLKLRAGDLRLGSSQPMYLSQSGFRSVRSRGGADMFHRLDADSIIELDAEVVAPEHDLGLSIGFSLRSAKGGLFDLRLIRYDVFSHDVFNALFKNRTDPVGVLFASPVASLLFSEDFETLPKIKRRIRSRESMLVLRNRIYQLRKRPEAYQNFIQQCSLVLCGAPDQFELQIAGSETESVELNVAVSTGADRQGRDIALLGSGALQIVEIMLALHSERRELTLLLLDEPDSHIHRDIQRRLMEALRRALSCQIFLTSHNESLIRHSRAEQIFHLEGKATGDFYPITREKVIGVKTGMQPSPYRKVLQSLGSETALDFVNALEADRLVLVEGEDDARHIHALVDMQKLQREPFHGMYWAFGGVDEIFINIDVYRRIFQSFKNGGSLWDKAVLVFDRDYLTDSMRVDLMAQLSQQLGIPVYIWESYTLEATALSEPEKLATLLTNLLRVKATAGIGEPVDLTKIASLLQGEILRHAEQWRERLGDAAHQDNLVTRREIFHLIRNKRDHLKETKILKHVTALKVTDAAIQPLFEKDALAKLTQGRIDHLTPKEEVLEILNAVARVFGVELDPTTWFLDLVQLPSLPTSWMSQWQQLQQLLRRPG